LTIGLLMKARPHEVGAANAFYGPVMAGISAAAAALAVDVRLDSLPVDEHYNPIDTGVVAANDDIAVAIIGELGGRVPSEVSVVGFDDIATASKIRPRLDTIAVDKPAMGRLAVALLVHRVNHPDDPAFTAVQPVEFVARDSTGSPP
jgi:DNA-binding LacI/PurR family transcriptional regulator